VSRIKGVLHDETGQDLIEYGLLAAFVSIVSLFTIRLIGPLVAALWNVVYSAII
jgi:Flp pilus assembly pilin Flp